MIRDLTFLDDIVEGVTRMIDSPPAPGPLEIRISEEGTTDAAPPLNQYDANSMDARKPMLLI